MTTAQRNAELVATSHDAEHTWLVRRGINFDLNH